MLTYLLRCSDARKEDAQNARESHEDRSEPNPRKYFDLLRHNASFSWVVEI